MPITDIISDAQALTLTIIADYPVPVERLWDAYADPRLLERFWGPKEWPATFTRHDMAVGGESHYYMTGPNGEIAGGWFRFLTVEPYRLLEMQDGFTNADGEKDESMPTMRMAFHFASTPTGSRYTSITHFTSGEAMEQLVQMGMLEGTKSAMSQIDAVLTDLATFAASAGTEAQLLSDTQVRVSRVSRVIRGPAELVWRAHHDPALMRRWLLGPDGWTMPVCDVAERVGDRYRYEWASNDGTQRFGFEGALLESMPPHREVASEQLIGSDGPPTRNELTLVPLTAGTLLSLVITYPSQALRDTILASGMTAGMEASYARLEREILSA